MSDLENALDQAVAVMGLVVGLIVLFGWAIW